MSRSILRPLCASLAVGLMATSMPRPALAGEAADGLTRADVNAQTRDAARAHLLVPAGEAALPAPQPGPRSMTTRRQVSSETLEAARQGSLVPAGEAAEWQTSRRSATSASTRTRSEVVAETRAAAKAHELTPAGEGWYPVRYHRNGT